MDTNENSSDDDDDAWNASQVPSAVCLAQPRLLQPFRSQENGTSANQDNQPNKPALQTNKNPLTTIFKTKVQGSTKRKRATPPKSTATTTTKTAATPATNNLAAPIVTSRPDFETPCTTTQMFMDRVDMLDVLAHRQQLLDLCARSLNILVYPSNEFRNGMRFSHCVFASKLIVDIGDFLSSRLFQNGDDLNNVFVLVWHERDLLQQTHITCMAGIYAQCQALAMDVLQFSMCVSKRLIC